MRKIKIGQCVPSKIIFSSLVYHEKSFNELVGQWTVLFFYPKDNTPGCTLEAQQFNSLRSKFDKMNVQIIGISRDTLKSHKKFSEKNNLKFDLISDENENLCQLFDVIKEKNMYGKKVMGIERSTFLLKENLELVYEWRKVKSDGHADEVFNKLKEFLKK